MGNLSVGPNGEKVTGWFVDHIKNPTYLGGIPSGDEPGFGLNPVMPIYFKVKDGIKAPYLQHVTDSAFDHGLTYSVFFFDVLESRFYTKPFSQIKHTDQVDFGNNIFPNNYKITVYDSQGNPHTIHGNESFTIVLVDPADITNPDWESCAVTIP